MWKSPWTLPGIALGFSLGGFFDGILLHQILQWHHLLSLVPGISDIRTQVLWDGYFHALMYLIALVGLWGSWRAQAQIGRCRGRRLLGLALIGFGAWHVVDGVLSHWLLGIHRIKIDSSIPLVWDLIWFFGFGVIPLVGGWLLARDDGGHMPRPSATRASLLLLTVGTVLAGVWSLKPPATQPFTTVVFRPGASAQQVAAAISSLDARLLWTDDAMGVVVVEVEPAERWRFYSQGALLVSGAGMPVGCFNWSRA
jgi:uncharacterized membrane protein